MKNEGRTAILQGGELTSLRSAQSDKVSAIFPKSISPLPLGWCAHAARPQQAEARSRFAFQASERAYRDGLIDLTTLLDAERSWRASRSSLTALQAGALNDAVSTIKALGGGWSGAPKKLRE